MIPSALIALAALATLIFLAVRAQNRGNRGWSSICGALGGIVLASCIVLMVESTVEPPTDYCTPAKRAREALLACNLLPHCTHGVAELMSADNLTLKCHAQKVPE